MGKYCLDYNELIERVWCDKTSFNDIFATDKLNENDVKKIEKKIKKKILYNLAKKGFKN